MYSRRRSVFQFLHRDDFIIIIIIIKKLTTDNDNTERHRRDSMKNTHYYHICISAPAVSRRRRVNPEICFWGPDFETHGSGSPERRTDVLCMYYRYEDHSRHKTTRRVFNVFFFFESRLASFSSRFTRRPSSAVLGCKFRKFRF